MAIAKSTSQQDIPDGGVPIWLTRTVEVPGVAAEAQYIFRDFEPGMRVHDCFINVATPALGTAFTATFSINSPLLFLAVAQDLTSGGISTYATAHHKITNTDLSQNHMTITPLTVTAITRLPIVEVHMLVSRTPQSPDHLL